MLLPLLSVVLAKPPAHQVTATSGRACRVALEVADDANANLVLDLAGTGVYSQVDDPASALYAQRVKAGEFAILKVDKPGVLKGRSDSARIDAEVFAAYTPLDLIDCTDAAISWAVAQPGVKRDGLVLMGHSEGSVVAMAVANRLVERGEKDRVATVVLSGFPVIGLGPSLVHQHGSKPLGDILDELAADEAKGLESQLLNGGGASAATLRAWAEWGANGDRLGTLVESRIPLLIQAGSRDDNVPSTHLTQWASEYTAPWMSIAYSESAHGGNLSMVVSRVVWIDAMTGHLPATGWFSGFGR